MLQRAGAVAAGGLLDSVVAPARVLAASLGAVGVRCNGHTCKPGEACCANLGCYDPASETCCPAQPAAVGLGLTANVCGFGECCGRGCCPRNRQCRSPDDPRECECCGGSVLEWDSKECCGASGRCEKRADDDICCDPLGICKEGQTCCRGECCDGPEEQCCYNTCYTPADHCCDHASGKVGGRCGQDCCADGELCCGETCCPKGHLCRDGHCYCPTESGLEPESQQYCHGECCKSGEVCCGGYECCPAGECVNGMCGGGIGCPHGSVACNGSCCDPPFGSGKVCCGGSCCPADTMCCAGDCVNSSVGTRGDNGLVTATSCCQSASANITNCNAYGGTTGYTGAGCCKGGQGGCVCTDGTCCIQGVGVCMPPGTPNAGTCQPS